MLKPVRVRGLALMAGGAGCRSSLPWPATIAAASIMPAMGAYWHRSITSAPRQVRTDEAVWTPVFGVPLL